MTADPVVDTDDAGDHPDDELRYLIDLSGDYFAGRERAIIPIPGVGTTRPARLPVPPESAEPGVPATPHANVALPDADPTLGEAVLDNPAWSALTGVHRRFAEVSGSAARYDPEVAGFVALDDPHSIQAWIDLATLLGPGVEFALAGDFDVPRGWTELAVVPGVQLVDVGLVKRHDPEAVRLTAADVPEMLDLVARTQPGPFRDRTIELGSYLGMRHDGKLVAMAGERLRPARWTEISAVCTDPAVRGQGLATRLVRSVAAGIAARGDSVFLHTSAENTAAINLYLSLGFRLRRTTTFRLLVTPT